MSKEVSLQTDMFSGELVDTRNRKQKKKAQKLEQPRQTEMFSQRELAQFGVRANPKLPISPKTRLELLVEDLRTEEEKERDFQQEVENLSYRLPGIDDDEEEIARKERSDSYLWEFTPGSAAISLENWVSYCLPE